MRYGFYHHSPFHHWHHHHWRHHYHRGGCCLLPGCSFFLLLPLIVLALALVVRF